MADDEDLENTTADMKVDDTILKLAEQYVSYENRARQLNKDKAAVREQADKLGIPSLAWQIGVRTVKIMDVKERADFQRGFRRVTSVLSKNADTLFPEDIERQKKRRSRKEEKAAKAAAAAAEAKAKSIEAGDDNPRSDPASGGAGKAAKKPRKSAAQAAADRAEDAAERAGKLRETQEQSPGASPGRVRPTEAELTAAAEQAEGADVLDSHIEGMKDAAKPKSQSAQVAEINEKLGFSNA